MDLKVKLKEVINLRKGTVFIFTGEYPSAYFLDYIANALPRDMNKRVERYGRTVKINGYNIDHIEKNGTKGTFYFSDVKQTFINSYDLGKVLVEPVEFNNAVKSLTTATRRHS